MTRVRDFIPQAGAGADQAIQAVTSNSKEVGPGTAFVAVRGGTHDGHAFLLQAQSEGAVCAAGEDEAPAGLTIPYLRVGDSRFLLAEWASRFEGNPSHSLLMIGVTGTSGKTTTTYLIESILKAAGHHVGVIGTVNFRHGDTIIPSTHTTPGAVELQRLLTRMKAEGCTAVVMEVSSHALKQSRSAGIAWDGMVFNNLSPEHLDFHPDMDDYFRAKALLFTDGAEASIRAGKTPFGAVNADDEYGRRLLDELAARPRPGFRRAGFSVASPDGFHFEDLTIDLGGIRGRFDGVAFQSSLTGLFNASNILAAATVCQGLGIPAPAIARGIETLACVPGRLERVPNTGGYHVLVDYAHKPDALEKVLKTLQAVQGGHRLITVFGCGGDRDRSKRPVMGRMAVELSDFTIITSDNPRTEDPAAIIQEILAGVFPVPGAQGKYRVEADRRKAIFSAIGLARPGDLVLIAGKGHEDYQIIGTTKIHFDDREVAADALAGLA